MSKPTAKPPVVARSAPAYDPTADLQGLLNIVNELLPKDQAITRALLANQATQHANALMTNWPKATA
jgi:hypothetical protein